MIEWTGKFAYKQVADDLRRRIADDEFTETGQLPSLAQLQERYGVTVTVARAAINQLKADGLAVSHQGKGAFLTPNAGRAAQVADPAAAVTELREEVEKLRTEVSDLRQRVAALEGD
ncbi:winged helix-turn-helix domain-containing protein [Streptomyces camelliae]|uniref:Winged helix-turn-helix domain-containing protein n=1 Tax=Streptomyces camelliae TaxID=3004093 RepID=A0ABY7P9I8_9ACTN|nr:winged helix-turn-helix domain-containing protein [Streptomyces sp. HUAS 2-6]WBO65998.1 winged helix-turn-helix domain-containing protein [Streptomyces sp. HUAS 2-6]